MLAIDGARCSVISASHPSRNSRTVSYLPSITSTVTLLSTPGRTTLIELLI
jgi:hypothetical protein